ncbi:SsgA family sporulation/cell division regulator [Streptomyces sp. NPDC056653]|uniref:SsgA family sporulation/cell division regulator n=1 Tax=Streptomyces sp. NPDC056653 TaxID=3345894 RepID=UPI00369419B3
MTGAQACLPSDSAEMEMAVHQILSPSTRVTIRARFYYASDDPFAVTVDLSTAERDTVSWTFSRDLLDAGTRHRAGLGDVRVWPTPTLSGNRLLNLSVGTFPNSAHFFMDAERIKKWLDRTYEIVPAGSESGVVDWEAAIAFLLA